MKKGPAFLRLSKWEVGSISPPTDFPNFPRVEVDDPAGGSPVVCSEVPSSPLLPIPDAGPPVGGREECCPVGEGPPRRVVALVPRNPHFTERAAKVAYRLRPPNALP